MNVPGTEPLSLTATRTDERTHLVTVVGDVDLATAARLAEYLDQFEDRNVVVTIEDNGAGMTESQLLAEYPQLVHEDVLAAIAYGAEASRERVMPVPMGGAA